MWREYELQVSAYKQALQEEEYIGDGNLPFYTLAILQLGYDRNKAGYKFTEIDDAFDLFKVAQQIWKREVGDGKPGYTQRDFPIILSPGNRKAPETVALPLEKIKKTIKKKQYAKRRFRRNDRGG